jgi:hypothetical protein
MHWGDSTSSELSVSVAAERECAYSGGGVKSCDRVQGVEGNLGAADDEVFGCGCPCGFSAEVKVTR